MDVRLAVGRIGDHVGQGLLLHSVEYISPENLADEQSRLSLVGKPVTLNHSGPQLGLVTAVDDSLTGGILWCNATIADQNLIDYMSEMKSRDVPLECSPEFTCDSRVDQHGRICQTNRRYSAISILSAAIAGRGGPDVVARYQASNIVDIKEDTKMEEMLREVLEMLASLSASMDEMKQRMGESTDDSMKEPTHEMSAEALDQAREEGLNDGRKEGMEFYSARDRLSSLLRPKNLDLIEGETLEALLANNLPILGVPSGSLEYMSGALAALHTQPQVATKPQAKSDKTHRLTFASRKK
jgi:hypothetical protein